MFFVKFNENGFISEFVEEEKEGFVEVPSLNCRLVDGIIIDKTEKVLNQDKIRELGNWFKTKYREYNEMLARRQRLGIEDEIVDNFRGKVYHNINELDLEAEAVAKEIRELRTEE